MLRLEMLPAAHGDCLWIEYGSDSEFGRILIDGGPAHTYPALRERILHLPATERHFDLLVITHIDADHIEGIVRLLQDAEALNCRFDRIWFNGRDQLNQVPDPTGRPLGAVQGEILGLLIADYEERVGKRVLNEGLPDRLGAIDRKTGSLPSVDLPGDCRLTLLSPDYERLRELKDRWKEELSKAGIVSGDTQALRRVLEKSRNLRPLGDELGATDAPMKNRFEFPDPESRDLAKSVADALGGASGEASAKDPFGCDKSKANGSSIAVLLEYPKSKPEVRLLLAGDAWAPVLEASLDQLLQPPDAQLPLTGFKLPHHGSVANVSESLLSKLRCENYLVSTSGAVFRHPHDRAIELLLTKHSGRGQPCLHFNYLTTTTARWNDPADQKARRYEASYPKGTSIVC